MDLNWLFEATNCRVVSDSRMDCLTGPGSGRAHLWEMKVGGRSSNRFNAQSSYAPPVVVDFASPDVRINDFATSGNDTIVITGRKFGPVSQEGKWSSMIDIIGISTWERGDDFTQFNSSDCFVSEPHTAITCKVSEGVGDSLKWDVIVDEQLSVIMTTSYGSPQIRRFMATKGGSHVVESDSGSISGLSTMGGEIVDIEGIHFGPCTTMGS